MGTALGLATIFVCLLYKWVKLKLASFNQSWCSHHFVCLALSTHSHRALFQQCWCSISISLVYSSVQSRLVATWKIHSGYYKRKNCFFYLPAYNYTVNKRSWVISLWLYQRLTDQPLADWITKGWLNHQWLYFVYSILEFWRSIVKAVLCFFFVFF